MIPEHPQPIIHTNGTGAKTLLEDYRAAFTAIREAIEKFERIEFNARDYYVSREPDAFMRARAARQHVFNQLKEAKVYCLAHAMTASEAIKS